MLSDYGTWRGSAAELGELATRLLREVDLEDTELSERLVRFYVQSEVLDRPLREGREARFGYRQLLQLLFARTMAANDWPLSKIAAYNQSASQKALLDLIPQPAPGRPTSHARDANEPRETTPAGDAALFAELVGAAAPLAVAARNSIGVPSRPWLELTLSSHCRVLLDQQLIHALDPTLVETLANSFEQALHKLAEKRLA